jgi:hypothetical protein
MITVGHFSAVMVFPCKGFRPPEETGAGKNNKKGACP